MEFLIRHIDGLLVSSLSCECEKFSPFMIWLGDTAAHVGIAGIVTAFILCCGWSRKLFWFGVTFIGAKELGFDLPRSGWAWQIWMDSIWDMIMI